MPSSPSFIMVVWRWCFTTPITSKVSGSGVVTRASMRWPTALPFGNSWAAIRLSMMMTLASGRLSSSVKSRPAMIGVRVKAK